MACTKPWIASDWLFSIEVGDIKTLLKPPPETVFLRSRCNTACQQLTEENQFTQHGERPSITWHSMKKHDFLNQETWLTHTCTHYKSNRRTFQLSRLQKKRKTHNFLFYKPGTVSFQELVFWYALLDFFTLQIDWPVAKYNLQNIREVGQKLMIMHERISCTKHDRWIQNNTNKGTVTFPKILIVCFYHLT